MIGESDELLRQANDIIGQVFLVAAFFIMTGVPLAILLLGVVNFIRAANRRGTIVLQALTAIGVWISHLRDCDDSHSHHLLVALSSFIR